MRAGGRSMAGGGRKAASVDVLLVARGRSTWLDNHGTRPRAPFFLASACSSALPEAPYWQGLYAACSARRLGSGRTAVQRASRVGRLLRRWAMRFGRLMQTRGLDARPAGAACRPCQWHGTALDLDPVQLDTVAQVSQVRLLALSSSSWRPASS